MLTENIKNARKCLYKNNCNSYKVLHILSSYKRKIRQHLKSRAESGASLSAAIHKCQESTEKKNVRIIITQCLKLIFH